MSNNAAIESFVTSASMALAIGCIGAVSVAGLVLLPIQTVSCRLQYVTCPKEVLQHTTELIGKPWLSTHIQNTLASHDLKAVQIHRSFPGHIDLTLAYTQTTQTPQVEPTDRASSLLSQTGIEHTAVTQVSDAALQVKLKNGQTALIDPYAMEDSVQRLKVILDNADLATVDTKIIEIDTRFKLPVLRTTLSYPTSASSSTTTTKEDNS